MEIIRDLVGPEYLYFDQPLEIRSSPHSLPLHLWAVCVSPKNELYLMDNEEQWHGIDWKEKEASLVIASLYQRLKIMRVHYAKAS